MRRLIISLVFASLPVPFGVAAQCQSVNQDVPIDDPVGLASTIVTDTSGAAGISVELNVKSGFVGELSVTLERDGTPGTVVLITGGSALAGNPYACSTFPQVLGGDSAPDTGGRVPIAFDDRRTVDVAELCQLSGWPFGSGTPFPGDGDGSIGGRFQPEMPIGALFDVGAENDTWNLKVVHSQLGEASPKGLGHLESWCVRPWESSLNAREDDNAAVLAQFGPARPMIGLFAFQLGILPIQDAQQFRQIEMDTDADWIRWATDAAKLRCLAFRADGTGVDAERWIGVPSGSAEGIKVESFDVSELLLAEPIPSQVQFAGCGNPGRVAVDAPFVRVTACEPGLSEPLEYEISEGPMCLTDENGPGPLRLLKGKVTNLGGVPVPFAMVHSSENRLTFADPAGNYELGVEAFQTGVVQASAPGFLTPDPIPYGPVPMVGTEVVDISLVPQPTVGNARLEFPSQITLAGDVVSPLIYGRVLVSGLTDASTEPAAGILAQVGFGDETRDPGSCQWQWFDMIPNPGFDFSAADDEYQGTVVARNAGDYRFAVRFSTDGGLSWTVGDLDGSPFSAGMAGPLTVTSNGETPYRNGFEQEICRAFLEIAD